VIPSNAKLSHKEESVRSHAACPTQSAKAELRQRRAFASFSGESRAEMDRPRSSRGSDSKRSLKITLI